MFLDPALAGSVLEFLLLCIYKFPIQVVKKQWNLYFIHTNPQKRKKKKGMESGEDNAYTD